jgi:hypothetical protein
MYSEEYRMIRRIGLRLVTILLAAGPVWAAALGTSARSIIPGEVQQIISVDYRQVSQAPVAESLRDKILPENLKQFETALRSVAIDPEKEIDQLTFVSFREGSQLRFVGLAQGQFPLKRIFARLKARKTKATRLRGNYLYDMGSGGLRMTLLDDSTMLFGELMSLTAALGARDGEMGSLNSNKALLDLMPEVESGPIWSVLDAAGTQTMLRSALGDAAKLADYETTKKRLLASRYAMDFTDGVNFNLDVITSDSMTAATLSRLIQAGVMFKKIQAAGAEKIALDSLNVDSEGDNLRMRFKTDDKNFESLLNSDLFAAVSR